ncbi:MAG: hypothetical protein ACRELY_01830 [Polyangiaceae bacterium]
MLVEIEETKLRARELPYLLQKVEQLELELATISTPTKPKRSYTDWLIVGAIALLALVICGALEYQHLASENCGIFASHCVVYDTFH